MRGGGEGDMKANYGKNQKECKGELINKGITAELFL